jgi:Zinc finger C-x8-C-x5-C-x3-H type (and similar)
MCRTFVTTGVCKYGAQCQFAHGVSDLRPLHGRQERLRAERCHAFWEEGYCPYGSRCRYRHDEEAAFLVVRDAAGAHIEVVPMKRGPRFHMMEVEQASPALPTVTLAPDDAAAADDAAASSGPAPHTPHGGHSSSGRRGRK